MGIQTRPVDRQSRLRQTLYDRQAELGQLLKVFFAREPVMAGSLYELRRKCGKPTCHCASGTELHSSLVISWTSQGRKRLRTVSKEEQPGLAALTRRYQLVRKARARLLEVQAEMLAIIDKLEAARRREP